MSFPAVHTFDHFTVMSSLEDLFMALPIDERQKTLQNMLEKMSTVENVPEAISTMPSTPEKPKAIKRELNSPDTPFKGKERKVYMKSGII